MGLMQNPSLRALKIGFIFGCVAAAGTTAFPVAGPLAGMAVVLYALKKDLVPNYKAALTGLALSGIFTHYAARHFEQDDAPRPGAAETRGCGLPPGIGR